MTKKDMLESLCNHYNDGNKAQFAARLGIKPAALSQWFARNSFDAELIYKTCPGVCADWLLSQGEVGDMLSSHFVNNEKEIFRLKTENDLLREIVGVKKEKQAV